MEMQIFAVVKKTWNMVQEHLLFQSHLLRSLPVFPVAHKADLFAANRE